MPKIIVSLSKTMSPQHHVADHSKLVQHHSELSEAHHATANLEEKKGRVKSAEAHRKLATHHNAIAKLHHILHKAQKRRESK